MNTQQISMMWSCLIAVALASSEARAGFIVGSPFGPFGEGGQVNGQTLTFGNTGDIYELNAFINVTGQNLNSNGTFAGTSERLSDGPVNGIPYTFSYTLSPDQSNLTLTYNFVNATTQPLNGFQFFVFVDPEINSSVSYTNEYGKVIGALGNGATDPSSWKIDEPGYVFGDIYKNLFNGKLDNTNSIPITSPEDVSLALGWQLGTLNPGASATINVLLSDNGSKLGSVALEDHSISVPEDVLTVSGQVQASAVPEPTSMIPFGIGLVTLAGYNGYRGRKSSSITP